MKSKFSLPAWVTFTPSWCRWDPNNPTPLTTWHCVLFAVAGGFFSANLFYSHPILDILAEEFHTTQNGVANIPTLAQAGDALGLVFLLPLADYFPRRHFSILLLSMAAVFWIGLCFTKSLAVFSALTFLSSIFTGVFNIFIVIISDMSTPAKRAFNISIAGTGPTLGILLARILSGIVATYVPWRYVYVMALVLQVTVLIGLYLFMPNYPAKNKVPMKQLIKSYPKNIASIATLYFKHPKLTQHGLLVFLTFFTVASFWTTLTFLLSEAPYHYTPFFIGLFGLIGASTMVLGPLYGKYIINPVNCALISAAIGKAVSFVSILIGTLVGRTNVAGPVIQAVLLDAGLMILVIANRVAIADIEPHRSNAVNTAFVAMLYAGQLSGTKAGNAVYEQYGGWLASGGLSLGIMGLSVVVILARGPNVKNDQWFGWTGGWKGRDSENEQLQTHTDEEKQNGSDLSSRDGNAVFEENKPERESKSVDMIESTLPDKSDDVTVESRTVEKDEIHHHHHHHCHHHDNTGPTLQDELVSPIVINLDEKK